MEISDLKVGTSVIKTIDLSKPEKDPTDFRF